MIYEEESAQETFGDYIIGKIQKEDLSLKTKMVPNEDDNEVKKNLEEKINITLLILENKELLLDYETFYEEDCQFSLLNWGYKYSKKINELLNKPTRRIYYIPLEDYREEEKEKLIEYYEFCLTKNYKIKTDIKGCKYYYPNIFRQLQGSDFDIEKSFDEIRKEIIFKIEKLPIVYNDIYK